MRKLRLTFKVISMLPAPIYIGMGLYVGLLGFLYFAGSAEYDAAFKCLAAGLPVALAGMVLFIPNKRIASSRTMAGIGLVALSILLNYAGRPLDFADSHSLWWITALIVVFVLLGVLSFLMYLREEQRSIKRAIIWLLIPLFIGLFGSGNSQWCRLIYMYQAYVDPWSQGPPNHPRCPRRYTGSWTEWYPNGKKKMEKNLLDGIYHGTPSKTEWYPSGQIKYVMNYDDGRKSYTLWYENGVKQLETDPADGTNIHWDESGNKKEGRLVQMHEKYPDRPFKEAHYKDGKLHGKLTEWDLQGKVSRLEYYNNGKLVEDHHTE